MTGLVSSLQAVGAWDAEKLTLTFVPLWTKTAGGSGRFRIDVSATCRIVESAVGTIIAVDIASHVAIQAGPDPDVDPRALPPDIGSAILIPRINIMYMT